MVSKKFTVMDRVAQVAGRAFTCSACEGQSKLAFERAPYRVKEGLWAHKPSPGYVHKAAVCPASAIWEKKNG